MDDAELQIDETRKSAIVARKAIEKQKEIAKRRLRKSMIATRMCILNTHT